MSEQKLLGFTIKEFFGYVLGTVFFIILIVIACTSSTGSKLSIVLTILGGSLGWLIGIILTPKNKKQTTLFINIKNFGASIMGGYVLGASDFQEIVKWLTSETAVEDIRIVLLAASFTLGFLMTYIGRQDVEDQNKNDDKDQKKDGV